MRNPNDPLSPLSESELQEAVTNSKIHKSATTLTDSLEPEIGFLMDAMGVEALFISDESRLSDFGLSESETSRLANSLGIEIFRKDLIVDVALRLTKRELQ